MSGGGAGDVPAHGGARGGAGGAKEGEGGGREEVVIMGRRHERRRGRSGRRQIAEWLNIPSRVKPRRGREEMADAGARERRPSDRKF